MENIFIYAGSRSAKLADYILIKNPKWFPTQVKYNVAIGRAIKTNWGRKSVSLLAKQIEEKGYQNTDINRELGTLLKKYDTGINLLDNKLDVVDSNSVSNLFKIPEIIKSNKVFNRLQEEQMNFYQISSVLNSENIEVTDEFLDAWLSKGTKEDKRYVINIITYLEEAVKHSDISYLRLRLSQAYTLIMNLGQSRDSYFKYTLFYKTSSSINYVIGNNNKLFINRLFQRNDSLVAHPLLDNKVATRFFENHSEFIHSYYTDTWKEALSIDHELRKNSKKSTDIKEFRSNKKVLFVTDANWNFLTTLISEIESLHTDIDVYDYSSFSKIMKRQDKNIYAKVLYSPLSTTLEEHSVNRNYLKEIDPVFFEKLENADIVFCEWGNETAVFLSKFAPPNTKIIVRVHSYEVFTFWHLFINLGGVDGFIFVAPHIKDIFLKNASSIHYDREMNNHIEVFPNVKDYSFITTEKDKESAFTLGLAGFNKINKGLIRALEILKKLHTEDNRWRLRLAGNHFVTDSLDYGYWKNVCEPYILDNNLQEVVIFDGYQNIPQWLKGIGFILSVSDREGTHEALVEGVSSGSIPLIVDWAMVKKFGGVSKLYPFLKDYIFEDIEGLDLISTKNLHHRYSAERLELSQKMQSMHDPKKISKNIYEFMGKVYEA